MAESKVKQADIAELIPDDKNFNKGTEYGQHLMDKSFEEFGAGRSILLDQNNRVIAGNKSLETYASKGGQKVVIVETTGDTLVAVKRTDVDLDSKQGREMALADNATAKANLDFDLDVINDVCEGYDITPEDWGIDMQSEEEQATEIEAKEDDFDEDKDHIEVRCKKGDIWQLGEHRLMCGDSIDLEQVKKLMGGVKCDLWITDPPYNVDYQGKEQYKKDRGYCYSVHEVAIANDKMKDKDFRAFLVGCYSAAKENMKDGATFYIWHADAEGYNFRGALLDVGGLKLSENLIWVKNQKVFGRQDYHWKHEPCLYGWKEGAGHKWYSDRSQTTTLNFDKPQKSDLHPTMKPIELFAYQIQNSSKVGDIVLDSFGGSGTTMIACEQLNRKARLMEFEPHYCDVILARWEKATGRKAELIENINDNV